MPSGFLFQREEERAVPPPSSSLERIRGVHSRERRRDPCPLSSSSGGGGDGCALCLPILERRREPCPLASSSRVRRKEPCPRLPLPLRGEENLPILESLAPPPSSSLERRRVSSYCREGGDGFVLYLPNLERRREPCPLASSSRERRKEPCSPPSCPQSSSYRERKKEPCPPSVFP